VAAPRDRFLVVNRLRHHLLDWGGSGPTVLLLHGLLEHAHAWDYVAPILADAGYHTVALDWRGHGDSEWIGAGGYYHFVDYTADLAFLTRALGTPVTLVGHSMGAVAAIGYAGTEPERVQGLVAIDALGPPDSPPTVAPDRFATWIADLERVAARSEHQPITLDAASARLAERFPRFPAAAAHHMALHGTIPADDGHRRWKFDPLHQSRAPQPYFVAQARAFWQRITCPVLYIEGGASPLGLAADDRADRIATLGARCLTLPDTGHHPHLEHPTTLGAALLDFLGRPQPAVMP
jgi:pimeloyl-ACP methyl ester carboxylesterase